MMLNTTKLVLAAALVISTISPAGAIGLHAVDSSNLDDVVSVEESFEDIAPDAEELRRFHEENEAAEADRAFRAPAFPRNGVEPFNIGAVGAWLGVIDQIVTLGERAYALVRENQPVVQLRPAMASAVPRDSDYFTQLGGWKIPRTQLYSKRFINGYGGTVAELKYKISYTYGGSYQGHGQYLKNVSVIPVETWVGWARTFNATVEIRDAVNLGTTARPVAGLEIVISTDASSVLNYAQGGSSYFVRGTGEINTL